MNTQAYRRGDWIVHKVYGVGQISEIEKKAISGEPTAYYKVESERSTFWIPVESDETDDYYRPLATAEQCQEVLDLLKRPAHEMHDNFRKRKNRIREVEKGDSILAVARLYRDLWVRRAKDKLNSTERRALRELRERLLAEWSTSMGVDKSEAKHRITAMLRRSTEKEITAD